MSNKKTAVEWLIEKIAEDYTEIPRAYKEECQKAKQMEKEQIMMAYNDGRVNQGLKQNKNSEQYYNETYENNGNKG
jgi:hypothetical protein